MIKIDKLKFDIITKTNEEYIQETYRCINFIDRYRSSSSSLDSFVQTLVDNSHKTLRNSEEEIVDNDEMLNIVNVTKIQIKEDMYKNVSLKVFL